MAAPVTLAPTPCPVLVHGSGANLETFLPSGVEMGARAPPGAENDVKAVRAHAEGV